MKPVTVAIVLFASVLMSATLLRAGAQSDRPLDPLVVAWDRGPDQIDVSKYPGDVKRKYKVFEDVCGRCHTLARAINCTFVLEDDWERYIKRMMRRGRGLVTPELAQQAFDFAVYDSKVRKKELYERRLKEAAAQEAGR